MFKMSFIVIVLGIFCLSASAQMDLKAYYEQQKAAILPTFATPELGSQITVHLKSGQSRAGILMKLDKATVSMMSDSGTMISYQRNALKEETRALLFAEDYAHARALEKTKTYNAQQQEQLVAQQEAGMHDGSIAVTAKTTKDSEKNREKEEKENKETGESIDISTTTKTQTETQKLTVTVTNQTGHPDKFTVEYYFFGKSVSKGGRKREGIEPAKGGTIKIHDNGHRSVTLQARGRDKLELTSKKFEVKSVETSKNGYAGNNPPKEDGIESAGYLVILKYGSTVLDKKASSRSYLDEEWLRQVR
jgi:hypothetical protein